MVTYLSRPEFKGIKTIECFDLDRKFPVGVGGITNSDILKSCVPPANVLEFVSNCG